MRISTSLLRTAKNKQCAVCGKKFTMISPAMRISTYHGSSKKVVTSYVVHTGYCHSQKIHELMAGNSE